MDRRSAVRHQVLKAGKIEFDGGAVICVAHNMSDNGAMLDVVDPIGVPEHFILFLRADGHRMPCRVVWRKEKRIGVTFE
jgi:PilZ domain